MKNVREVNFRNLLAYGSGDIYGGGSFLLISMFFLFYLTNVVGLSPAVSGIIIGLGSIWDGLSDPMMGYISDNTRTRLGRRRVFFLIGIIPIAVSFILMWLPMRFDNSAMTAVYFGFAYILFKTVFTMVMVPYAALNAEMTPDYKIRTRLSGARIIFSQFSALLAATIPALIIKAFQPIEKGYVVMAVIFGIFYAAPWILVFLGTWEDSDLNEAKDPKAIKQVFSEFLTLRKNKTFLYHILMYLFAYTAMDGLMNLFKFYLELNLQKGHLFSLAMGSLMGTQILMMSVYVYISNKKGKGFSYRMGFILWAIGMGAAFFLTEDSSTLLLVLTSILLGTGVSAAIMIPWAILPSVIDVDELITTKQRAGTYSGSMTLVRKIAQGITIAGIGAMLSLIGFVSPEIVVVNGIPKAVAQVQSPETLANLKLLFFATPVVFLITGFLVSLKFKITPETHKILTDEIARLKAGGSKADVSPETKAVCEELTGSKYEKLYKKQ
ncbi:MAG: MFS transporter [Spirochaetia bacterium]|nr:MFS transporter [Spirochaetia bacterium]